VMETKEGDILSAAVEALVNSVNTVGISGRGIALLFRKAFPENFKAYRAACKHGEVRPGRMFVFKTGYLTNPRYIINFPTKRHWREKSRLADIEAGLRDLVRVVRRLRIRSVAIPPLGSGLGGLDWSQVRPKIEAALAELPNVHAIVYEPSGAPEPRPMVKTAEAPRMTPGRAALVGLMQRYLVGLMEPFVSLLEVHKLMYFMQEAGEPLRLRYVKALYGPYAENLRQVLSRIEGYFVSGYADGGDEPEKRLELMSGAVPTATKFLSENPATLSRFDRVADLVQGFETPFGLELLSTVHWVATREGATTVQQAIQYAYAWSARKERFSREQIQIAWNALLEKGWLSR